MKELKKISREVREIQKREEEIKQEKKRIKQLEKEKLIDEKNQENWKRYHFENQFEYDHFMSYLYYPEIEDNDDIINLKKFHESYYNLVHKYAELIKNDLELMKT